MEKPSHEHGAVSVTKAPNEYEKSESEDKAPAFGRLLRNSSEVITVHNEEWGSPSEGDSTAITTEKLREIVDVLIHENCGIGMTSGALAWMCRIGYLFLSL